MNNSIEAEQCMRCEGPAVRGAALPGASSVPWAAGYTLYPPGAYRDPWAAAAAATASAVFLPDLASGWKPGEMCID